MMNLRDALEKTLDEAKDSGRREMKREIWALILSLIENSRLTTPSAHACLRAIERMKS